jgi:type VI protein secretion system component VasK
MSRRAAWLLIALCAWTLWVWLTFTWIIGHQDHPMGFKVVHGLIALGSIAFGLAAGWIGYRGLRPARAQNSDAEIMDREVMGSR